MDFNPGTSIIIAPDSTQDVIRAIDNFRIAVVNALNSFLMTNTYGNFNSYNSAIAVVILVIDTFVKIASGMTVGLLSGITFQNNSELVVGAAGRYLIQGQISCTSSTAAEEIELGVMVDGTVTPAITGHAEVSIGGITRPGSISVSGILNLAPGTILALAVANYSTTADITVQHCNFTVVRIA